MDTVGFSEYLGVADTTPNADAPHEIAPQERVVTYCDLEAANRCKEEVRFGPGLAPTGFRSAVICYVDCSKKRFISRVEYSPRMKPRRFSVTCYLRPRHLVKSCATFIDVPSETSRRRWYKSSVRMEPKTFSSCKVQGSAGVEGSNLQYSKTVEEKEVQADGTVKVHIENYRNGELINISDVMRQQRDVSVSSNDVMVDSDVMGRSGLRNELDDVGNSHNGIMSGSDVMIASSVMGGNDVMTESDSDYNPRIQEALDSLATKRWIRDSIRAGDNGESTEDLVWMDGFMDPHNNIVPIPIRNRDSPAYPPFSPDYPPLSPGGEPLSPGYPPLRVPYSPDLFYQADDEDAEMWVDDNDNVTHDVMNNIKHNTTHNHRKKHRKSTTPTNQTPPTLNATQIITSNTHQSSKFYQDSFVQDIYRSGPFVYDAPSKYELSDGGENLDDMDYKQVNGMLSQSIGRTIRYSEQFTQYHGTDTTRDSNYFMT